jgi:hypothetical protein
MPRTGSQAAKQAWTRRAGDAAAARQCEFTRVARRADPSRSPLTAGRDCVSGRALFHEQLQRPEQVGLHLPTSAITVPYIDMHIDTGPS